MSDVPDCSRRHPTLRRSFPALKISRVDGLKAKGVIDKGMRPKVGSAVRALEEGVQRVHLVDGRLPHCATARDFYGQGHRHRNCARVIVLLLFRVGRFSGWRGVHGAPVIGRSFSERS